MENEGRKKLSDREKLKRIAAVVVGILLVLLLLTGVLWLISSLLSKHRENPNPDATTSYKFYEADYDRNILEDPAYQRLDHSILYLEYGTGETLTETNYQTMGVASNFFYAYFDAIIRGDCEAYRAFLTPHYIETFDPPERFTMQMLYNIEVNREQQMSTAVYEGRTVNVYYFSVKYSIFENNGTFRNDVMSNKSTTQYYELYDVNGRCYLNAISDKKMVLN